MKMKFWKTTISISLIVTLLISIGILSIQEAEAAPVNWGRDVQNTLATTTAHSRAMGGTSPNVDNMLIKSVSIYLGPQTGEVRLAVYTGGALDNPTAATLLWDAGTVNPNGVAGWYTINHPTGGVSWPKNTVTWLAWKRDTAVPVYYSSSSSGAGNFQTARGYNGNNFDQSPTVAFPGIYGQTGTFTNAWHSIYVTYDIAPPVANFIGSPLSGAVPLLVSFTDTSIGTISSWSWNFGDGVGTSNLPNPYYTYSTPGTYTVTLTVTGPGGTDDEIKTDYITVGEAPPVAGFTGTPLSGAAPLLVNFTDQSIGTISSWSWNFGDGVGSSNLQNPSYTYTSTGTYTVTLTVTSPGGSDSETKANYIVVGDTPIIANFTANQTSGVDPLLVQFTDASVGTISSWSWNFGDGVGTSNLQNPSYTYNNPGTYTVSLTVTGPDGSDQEIKTNYITVINDPPQFIIANFSPPDGATGISQTPSLRWAAQDPDTGDTVVYDIYFGTSPSPPLVVSNQVTFVYMPGQLSHMTVYYWKIVARDTHGAETTSPILSFTTLSNPPSFTMFSPLNMSTGILLTPTLTWYATDPDPGDTLVYDVYFGTSATPPLVSSNQTGTSYQPGLLSYSTRYYWRIVARDNHGAVTSLPSAGALYFDTESIDVVVDHSDSIVSRPQVAADGNGHVYVVWEDTRNEGSDIYFNYSTDYGVTWQFSDKRIDTDTPGANNSTFPRIACDNSGHVYVVWQDDRNDSSDIYFNVSSDYGITWLSSDKRLSTAAYAPPAQSPMIACDNNGHVYVAWDDNYFNRSANYGITWLTQPTRISTSGGMGTRLKCDQNGHVYIAWRTSDVLFDYSSDYGVTWQTMDRIISDPDALPYFLSLESNENGNISVAWHDGRNNANSPDIYFNSSSNYGNTWGAADIMLNKGTPGATYSIWPEVASDETGNVYVAWYDRRNGEGDIYINFSSDFGANWQVSDVRLDTDAPGTVDSGYPLIAIDASGSVYVVWDDDQASVGGHGMYMNYSLDYGTTWLATNKKVGYSGGFNPRITADGNRVYIVRDYNDIVFSQVAIFLPIYPSPADKATQVSRIPALRWRGGNLYLDNTLTYDVYFGTSSPPPLASPNQIGTTYIPGMLEYFTTYYWKVVSRDSSGFETPGPIWSFTTVSNPPQFIDFSPPDGAIDIDMFNPTLSWTATDPNPGDTIKYDIYLGTGPNPPLVVSNHDSTSYQAGLLFHMTKYYWKIVARDNHGSETVGPILSFTTRNTPPQFNSYSPPDGATNKSRTTTLNWSASDPNGDPLTYDIYFGTSSPPPLVLANQTVTTYNPGQLNYLTWYYWKVAVRDHHGAVVESPIMSFRTESTPPSFLDFSPPNNSVDVVSRPLLTWTVSDPDPDEELSYDIYFGVLPSPPRELSNSPFTNFDPGKLNYATRYYWKIVAFDKYGAKTVGPVLSFVTANPPQIVTVEPNPCQTSKIISIIGMRFGDTQGTSEIHLGKKVFGPGNARIKYWSDARIDFKVPPYVMWLPGTTKTINLWVRRNGFNSNKFPLTISNP